MPDRLHDVGPTSCVWCFRERYAYHLFYALHPFFEYIHLPVGWRYAYHPCCCDVSVLSSTMRTITAMSRHPETHPRNFLTQFHEKTPKGRTNMPLSRRRQKRGYLLLLQVITLAGPKNTPWANSFASKLANASHMTLTTQHFYTHRYQKSNAGTPVCVLKCSDRTGYNAILEGKRAEKCKM